MDTRLPKTISYANKVKQTKDKGKGLFSGKLFEHGDIIEFCEYKKVYSRLFRELSDEDRKYLFEYNGEYIYTDDNIKYINHSSLYNAFIHIDKKYIYAVANQTIHQGEEITLDYGDDNIDFEVF